MSQFNPSGIPRRVRVVGLSAALVTLSVVGIAPGAQARSSGQPSDQVDLPPIEWAACDLGFPPELELPALDCATVAVPLDYDEPQGATTPLAMYRRPATDGDAEQGDVFTNPGGPGGQGLIIPLFSDAIFDPDVLSAYNIVGLDPRGVGGSAELQCFPSNTALIEFFESLGPDAAFPPRSDAEWETERRFVRGYNDACDAGAGPIIDHMSTANLARDIDVVRRAEGNTRTNFVGYSYGSYVATTYAALFPSRSHRLVSDGNIDPVGYATGRPELPGRLLTTWGRFNGAPGGALALAEFFRLCDEAGPERCAFAGDSAARFEALIAALREKPLVDPAVPGLAVDDRQVLGFTFQSLYLVETFPTLAATLAEFERLVAGGEFPPAPEVPEEEMPDLDDLPYLGGEAFWGVPCSESVNPVRFSVMRAGTEASADQGLFGPLLNANQHLCQDWRGVDDDAFQGPFDTRGRNLLVVNPRFDPITPLVNAEIVQDLWRGSTLVTYEGWGHTAGGVSSCVDGIVGEYLLTGRTPRQRDVSCPVDADVVPFPEIVVAPTGSDLPADVAAAGTPEAGQDAAAQLAETADTTEVVADIAEDAAEVAEAAGDTDHARSIRARAALLSVNAGATVPAS